MMVKWIDAEMARKRVRQLERELDDARQQNAHWRTEALAVLGRTEQERDDASVRLAAAERVVDEARSIDPKDRSFGMDDALASFDAATVGQENDHV
jgi:electron transfer flavoprotein alpha subunit